MTDDIVEFIKAQLAEDEERATYAQTVISDSWDGWEPIAHQLAADCDTVSNVSRLDQHLHYNADPAHVLAEVEAKRAIVEDCAKAYETARRFHGDDEFSYAPHARLALRTLRRLAAPYAERPGFNPKWALT